ncbi:Hypothetical protein R9X50_00428400 [Acrodontium crateriforme]|uniref:Malate dehydrogenase n=1 Tax=Acrodontium crateriforme TaxID=150365 RepID=A0AAQ3RCL1_9PEZI|nr:Hypothetical protein R9X50_00428400 [Acrodontium crateriforme]
MVVVLAAFIAVSGLISSTAAYPACPVGRSPNLAAQQPTEPGLPSNNNATFKYVALGLGVQNYTCASTSATPVAAGALATLFDATNAYAKLTVLINHSTEPYLKMYEMESCTKFGNPNVADDSCEQKANVARLPVIGHHYFADINGKGVPSFDIQYDYLSCAKYGDVKAPADTYAGSDNAGAVDWLFLADDSNGRTHGLKEVYRVKTVGGVPAAGACSSGAKSFGVKYAAQYWFYD